MERRGTKEAGAMTGAKEAATGAKAAGDRMTARAKEAIGGKDGTKAAGTKAAGIKVVGTKVAGEKTAGMHGQVKEVATGEKEEKIGKVAAGDMMEARARTRTRARARAGSPFALFSHIF